MNQIMKWLSGGDLRSDGSSSEVAELTLENPQLVDDLLEGLTSPNDVIRGRTADALEKVARVKPKLFLNHLAGIVQIAETDPVPMVKMHLAMLLGHLTACGEMIPEISAALLNLLDDESAFTKSWAIVSLCILARKYPSMNGHFRSRIACHQTDKSNAIRTRVRKALALLGDESVQFPKGWIKSIHLKDLSKL